MIPDPLHPAVVHFPIVLAVLAPIAAATAFWAIHSGRATRRSWVGIVVLQIALVGVTWAATETGEREEERVERVVAERHIEAHEEAGERFLLLAALVLPLAGGGLLRGSLGTVHRALTIALSAAALLAAGAAGHTGGELVYRPGASAAYGKPGTNGPPLAHSGDAMLYEEDDD
ncbi:MAG: DUF2231 domain-containing protein [Myxococcota bacterium]